MPFTFKPAYQLIMRDDRNPFFIFTFSFPWRWRESSTIDGISCAAKYITLYQAWARSCRWREISWNNQLLFNHHSSHHSSLSFFTTFFSFASYRDYISERGITESVQAFLRRKKVIYLLTASTKYEKRDSQLSSLSCKQQNAILIIRQGYAFLSRRLTEVVSFSINRSAWGGCGPW